MKVEINYVKWLKAELRKINLQPFEKIVWTKDGKKQEYPAKMLEEWKYIGLSNVEFPFIDWIQNEQS